MIQQTASITPQLSIGLPVFNGENYLHTCINSVLSQTVTDFELIISDNGSTDGTRAICEHYAEHDDRVRYFRHEDNQGATFNFNFCVKQSRAMLFKWAAHDDVHDSTYLEKCLPLIQNDENVVLSHSKVRIIDNLGNTLYYEDYPLDLTNPDRIIRFRELCVERHDCVLIFGIMRLSALKRTALIQDYVGSDRILLAHLALLGKIIEHPDVLFDRRKHEQNSNKIDEREGRLHWFNPHSKARVHFPDWRRLLEFLKTGLAEANTITEHLRILLICGQYAFRRRSSLWQDLITGFRLQLKRSRIISALYYRYVRR